MSHAEEKIMVRMSRIEERSWLIRLSRIVRLSTLMAFPFQALEPDLYRRVDWAD